MKEVIARLAALLMLFSMLPLVALAQDDSESWGCWLFGWMVRPIGWCEIQEVEVTVVTHDREVVDEAEKPESEIIRETVVYEYSTTTQPIYQDVTNEYITVQQSGIGEQLLNQRIAEVLMYIDSLPHGVESGVATEVVYVPQEQSSPIVRTAQPGSGGLYEYVTKDYVVKSLDSVYEEIGDIDTSGGGGSDFNPDTITDLSNLNLLGTTYVSGSLGIGTTSPSDVLALAGAIYLGETTPGNPANRLYNNGGNLYWNGALLSSSTAGTLAGLTDVNLTGAVAGSLLLYNGSGWATTSTSSLGIVGGGSSLWSESGSDIYFDSGRVSVGTTSTSSNLVVAGTALFTGTTTAPLIDTGGQVCDVRAYGAVGDNSTLNDAAIAAAIADCPEGGTVYFPMGEFRIANPIVLDRPVTLRGAYSPRWSYSSTPRSSIRADFGSFSGVAMIHVRDRSISGEPEDNNGGRLEYISLDGGSASTDVNGIYFEGLVRDWKLTDVDISQVTGNGFEAAVGTGSGNPRGFTIRGLSIYSADGHGFRATALNDTYIDDLLAVGNALRGIYLSSMGETKVANSRAVFNGLTGLYIDGSSNNGGITFTDFSTDRNDRHGVRISATGTSTIIFNGLLTRRDGPNTSGGSETPYAGLAIIGSTTDKVAPVFVSGLGQTVGVDDSGNPPLSPEVGVRVTNAEYVKIDGQLWGVDFAYADDGGNDYFIIEEDAIMKTGTAGAQEIYADITEWQATSSGVFYGNGTVSIGSTTGTRLLNIIAPQQAGARFQDTTNNVIFDMRAEDFQAFFGTFSNHQLRFQTNNTSRLTIDNDGDIGIGTTTPVAMLEVWASNTDDLLRLFDQTGNALMVVEEGGNIGIGTSTPQDALQIAGGGIILDNDQTIRWYDNTNNLDTILRYDATNDLEIGFGVGNVTQISAQNGIQFRTGVGEIARFNSNGDFGIGDTSPDFALEVATSSATGYFGVTDTVNGDVFTIDTAGDVGVGTNNPGERLHISGGNLLMENTRAIRWQNNSATPNTIMAYNSSNALEIGSGIGGALELYGNNNMLFHIGGEEIGRFNSAGNLGLYDASPDYRFEIASTSGTGYFAISDAEDGDVLAVDASGNVGIGTSSPVSRLTIAGVVTPDVNNTYSLGNATYRWSEVFAANGTINTSDRRLKDDITDLRYGIDEILALEPITFVWKDNPEQGVRVGLIAQDVEDIIPEIVYTGDDPDKTKGIRYTELIAVLIEAMQEMWKDITGNTERIEALEERIAELESELDVEPAPVLEPEPEPEQEPVEPAPSQGEEESGSAEESDEVVEEESESVGEEPKEELPAEPAEPEENEDTAEPVNTTEEEPEREAEILTEE